MIVVVDGPEKVGKSTLVRQLVESLEDRGLRSRVRKWGIIFPDDRVYLEPLSQDAADPDTVSIWDRSWASEHVYGKLLSRDRRLASDPWLGEWLYGRAVSSCGMKVMMTANPSRLAELRDDTDLPVDPVEEFKAFFGYGDKFEWDIMSTAYSKVGLGMAVNYIIDLLISSQHPPSFPPIYAGPRAPRVVFVGEVRSNHPQMIGAWLPFTSRYTTEFARTLDSEAMSCGWTNCHEIAPQRLRGVQVIVSCGQQASNWVKNYVMTSRDSSIHINLPHPSWTYRYSNERTAQSRKTTESVMAVIKEFSAGRSDIDYLERYASRLKVLQ